MTFTLDYGDETEERAIVERGDGEAKLRFEHRFPSIGKKVEEAGLELYKWEWGQLAFADEPWVTPATMVTTHTSRRNGMR